MSLGTGIVLFVIGAILAFALNIQVDWINLHLVGYILMVAGVVGIIIGIILLTRRRRTIATTRTAVDPVTGDRVTRRGVDDEAPPATWSARVAPVSASTGSSATTASRELCFTSASPGFVSWFASHRPVFCHPPPGWMTQYTFAPNQLLSASHTSTGPATGSAPRNFRAAAPRIA